MLGFSSTYISLTDVVMVRLESIEKEKALETKALSSSGRRTRTSDLRVMSPRLYFLYIYLSGTYDFVIHVVYSEFRRIHTVITCRNCSLPNSESNNNDTRNLGAFPRFSIKKQYQKLKSHFLEFRVFWYSHSINNHLWKD